MAIAKCKEDLMQPSTLGHTGNKNNIPGGHRLEIESCNPSQAYQRG
jgi:hypothetical protein